MFDRARLAFRAALNRAQHSISRPQRSTSRIRGATHPEATAGDERAALRSAAALSVHRKVLLFDCTPEETATFVRHSADSAQIVTEDSEEKADVVVTRSAALDIERVRSRLAPDGVVVLLHRALPSVHDFTVIFELGTITVATNDERWRQPRLHIGCGPETLPGWINIDNQPYRGVDLLWDISEGIPFRNARLMFAEHFIEHLSYEAAAFFASECRRALSDDGVLRLSTPNLDWVWSIAYRPHAWETKEQAQRDCFIANRAFRAWGHQFLYNAQTLEALLHNAGFAEVTFHQYGESGAPELRNRERHPRDADDPSLPHVIIAEARGTRRPTVIEGEQLIADYHRDLAAK
jgi:predicted SAM-dependent methyltransferase